MPACCKGSFRQVMGTGSRPLARFQVPINAGEPARCFNHYRSADQSIQSLCEQKSFGTGCRREPSVADCCARSGLTFSVGRDDCFELLLRYGARLVPFGASRRAGPPGALK